MALRERTNSGMPSGSQPWNLRDGGFGDHQAGRIHAEIVVAGDDAGIAVHEDAIALRGNDVEDDAPARAGKVAGPVVVGDDDPAIPGVAAGGDEGAAIAGADEAGAFARFLLIEHGNVVVGDLFGGVQRDDVLRSTLTPWALTPSAMPWSSCWYSFSMCGQRIFCGSGGRRSSRAWCGGCLHLGVEGVCDFWCEEISVLEADSEGEPSRWT